MHLEQLRAAGIGRHALAHRVRGGWLRQVYRRVYSLSGRQATLPGRCMAAALHLSGDGVVTGRAAAQLWGPLDTTQTPTDEDPIDVLLVGRTAAPAPGIRIHRSQSLARQDVRRRDGIPAASPARTLLDLAGQLDVLELEAVLAAAARLRLVRAAELADVTARNPRARGVARLRALAEGAAAPRDTRSVYERRLLRLLAAAELPLPLTNVRVAGALVDGFWPELGLVLEVDGWRHHHQRDQFERDRLRDQIQVAAGHRTLRVTAWQIDHHPYALVARVATVIARLRAGGSGSGAPAGG